MRGVRFRVLGGVDVVGPDGAVRAIGSANQRTVLAVLLAHRGAVLSVDALVDAVWAEAPPPSAVPTLRTYVSRLRAQVGGDLASRGHGFVLDVAAEEVDAGRFERLVDEAREAPPALAAARLDEALGLWRGPAFGDRFDVAGVRGEARRLEERRAGARAARVAALLGAGRAEDAAAAAEALVADEPLREGGWALLVEALAASDRTAEALRAFRRAAAALAEAGLEPSARLRAAEAVVLAAVPPAPRPARAAPPAVRHPAAPAPPPAPHPAAPAPAAPAPAAPADGPALCLPPVPRSSFVGREADLGAVADLLDTVPLVTLVGPGGVGKTRLALEVACLAGRRRAMGARLVELARVSAADDVADLVVAGLGLAADGAGAAEVLDRARRLDLLVVLDNAEHVIDGVAVVAERLLAGESALRLLVTSRERLGVDGEHVWPLAPLATDGPDAPARRLFLDRARAAVPGAELSGDDADVARLVRRLDGLPLAIEMAAGQLPTAALAELADELEDRYDVLRSPRRDVAGRHRTLTALLEWSETQLGDRERAVLAELSVFSGPVPAGDLDGVLSGPGAAGVVRSLAARSLVDVDRAGDRARFGLLQTVRSFAADRLRRDGPHAGALARQHAEWYAGVAAEADGGLRGVGEAAAHRRMEESLAELRAAHRWARDHDVALAARLSAALHHYAQSRLVDEPLRWAEELAPALPPGDPHRPEVLASAATRAIQRGDLETARRLAGEAVAGAGEGPPSFGALEALADSSLFSGRLEESEAAYATLAERALRAGDLYYFSVARSGVTLARCYGGQHPAPDELADLEPMALGPSSRGWVHYTNGEVLGDVDPDAAFDEYGRALALARAGGNRVLEGVALVSSCALRARAGDVAAAVGTFDAAIRHWRRLAATAHQLTTLRNLAVLLRRLDEPGLAAELVGAVEDDVVPTYGAEADRLAAVREWAAGRLGGPAFGAALDRGRRRPRPTVEDWALAALASVATGARAGSVAPVPADSGAG